MARLLFVVNTLESLTPTQATAALIHEAAVAGHEVWVAEASGPGLTPVGVEALATRARPHGDRAAVVVALRTDPSEAVSAAQVDGVWVRTNPGRAAGGGEALLQLLQQVQDTGVTVRNDPTGLQRAASKLFLGSLPRSTVPDTWASSKVSRLREHLEDLGGRGVVKPAIGTRGEGTVMVDLSMPDLDAVLAAATASGPALLQAYVPEAPEGDVRVHVVGGRLLELDGAAAVVRRVPKAGEWRSNVALGGTPQATEATDSIRDLVETLGPLLMAQGLWHVGLDVVGDRVVECNVFSPGGLDDIERFTGMAFVGPLVERFVASL